MDPRLKPKAEFLATPDSKVWAEMVFNPVTRCAMRVALLEWFYNQVTPESSYQDAANAWKMVGVKEYIHVLLHLAEPPGPPPKSVRQNLKPV